MMARWQHAQSKFCVVLVEREAGLRASVAAMAIWTMQLTSVVSDQCPGGTKVVTVPVWLGGSMKPQSALPEPPAPNDAMA